MQVMTSQKALKEFDALQTEGYTVDTAIAVAMAQLKWLDTVAEWEYSDRDKSKIVDACRTFVGVIRPVVVKYTGME